MIEEIFRKTNIVDAVLILVASVAIVSFWRGCWGLMDIFIFPEYPVLSHLITIIFALMILLGITLYQGKHKKIKVNIKS